MKLEHGVSHVGVAARQGMDWVWEMLRLTLAPALPPGADLPRVIYLDDLEHTKLKRWMCVGTALLVTDRCAAAPRTPGNS